jgi:hypothetical protein
MKWKCNHLYKSRDAFKPLPLPLHRRRHPPILLLLLLVMSTTAEREEKEGVLVVTIPITDREVTANIHTARSTSISFIYMRTPYQFDITKWSGQGVRKLTELFFAHTARDPGTFGTAITYDDQERATSLPLTPTQRRNVIFQASIDILTCLSKIVHVHQRQVLDYAVWYREQKAKGDSYRSYITLITCHCIVHSEFMSGSVQYELVEL